MNHILQEGFKRAEVVCLGGVVTADDPNLIFFGKESRADKRIDANVNGVHFGHGGLKRLTNVKYNITEKCEASTSNPIDGCASRWPLSSDWSPGLQLS